MERFEIKKFGECNIYDTFFDSLKSDYVDFIDWYNRNLDRNVYIYQNIDKIQAILILKKNEEEEIILKDKVLPKKMRLKICTLKVSEGSRNKKLGEEAIDIALRHFNEGKEEEIYITTFKKQIALISLLKKFGFEDKGEKMNGEHVYLRCRK